MPYIEGRVVHDADAHIMEEPTWLIDHADPDVRERCDPHVGARRWRPARRDVIDHYRRATPTPSSGPATPSRDHGAQELQGHRLVHRRGPARSPSTCSAWPASSCSTRSTTATCCASSASGDLDLAYGAARAHNRGMVEFCAVDRRLLPTCYVPLADFDRVGGDGRRGHRHGRRRAAGADGCPHDHSPSHIGLDPVWRQAEEAGIPIVLHVGGGGQLLDPMYFDNGGRLRQGLPRRRRELPLGRLHGHPRPAGADRSPR